MYKPESHTDNICADYTKSTAEPFQEVAKFVAVKYQDLTMWRFIQLESSVRKENDGLLSLGALLPSISYGIWCVRRSREIELSKKPVADIC
jgi:hypothetical protein